MLGIAAEGAGVLHNRCTCVARYLVKVKAVRESCEGEKVPDQKQAFEIPDNQLQWAYPAVELRSIYKAATIKITRYLLRLS